MLYLPSIVNATEAAGAAHENAELGQLHAAWQRYVLYGALIVVIAFFAVVRARLAHVPLERDEGEYAYAGQLLLEGIPPYKLAYNMKLPGTYAVYAVIMAVFGQTAAAIHWGVLLVNAATTILVFLLAKRLHGPLTGVVAGTTYALLSTRSSVSFDGHATHFLTLFAVAGILLLLYANDGKTDTQIDKRIPKKRLGLLFASGFLLGLAILMKQHGIFLAIFAGLYLLWKERRSPIRNLIVVGAVFCGAVALPFLVTCLLLYRAGVFRQFWFWTFSYGRAYAAEMTLRDGWEMLRAVGPWMVRPFVIWEIAAVGLLALFWNRKVRARADFSVGFLFFSALAVVPGLYFRPHYFIVMFPAVALWAGIGVTASYEWLDQRKSARFPAGISLAGISLAWVPVFVFLIAFAVSIHGQRKFFFGDPLTVYRALHQQRGCGDGCAEAETVGDYIAANSSQQDDVAVLGSEPEIYFYSHRHSATGYIYMYGLTEKQKYALQMRQEMIQEVERARPKFLVYVDDANSWWNLGSTKELAYLQPLQQWIFSQYELQKVVVIPGDAEHQWRDHPAFYVFRRSDNPKQWPIVNAAIEGENIRYRTD
jgi:4-amino-4-deoxy-L-arabinose transferase-like glycosyltransferase